MLTLLKLGGSLITDKRQPEAARFDVIRRLAAEIAEARQNNPQLKLVIGNGAGSFGHLHAKQYGTRQGVKTSDEWQGFALTADAAVRLNRLVATALLDVGLPVWSIQPSASLRCQDGRIVAGLAESVALALERGLVPLVHGDVALDSVRGGTIASTEEIFEWLVDKLPALLPDDLSDLWALRRMVLAGEVDGIYTADPLIDRTAEPIAQLTPNNVAEVIESLGASHGVDVTGGMLSKVTQVLQIVERTPTLEIVICSGLVPGALTKALSPTGYSSGGTWIRVKGVD